MAIGTNDTIEKRGSQATLVSSGALIAAAAFSADTAAYSSTESQDAPDAELVLTYTPTVAPAANQAIYIYIRPMNIDGTKDAPVPDANYKNDYFGKFKTDVVAAEQPLREIVKGIPEQGEIYLENASGQSIPAGWTLKFKPLTLGPSA